MMWEIISNGHVKELIEMLTDYPELAHSRSADGRGPMFWAMEYGNEKIIRVLKKVGVSTTVKDAKGLTPLDLKKKTNEL
jgi:dolichyl-diphosphooligosaccharide--protein glycosyltransferase